MVFTSILPLFLVLLASTSASKPHHGHDHKIEHTKQHHQEVPSSGSTQGVMAIDQGVEYGYILPYINEWNDFFGKSTDRTELSPMQFWFRCIDREVRGYFFVENLDPQRHGKEADMHSGYYRDNLKITADGVPVQFRIWNGGGDFFFNITGDLAPDRNVDVKVKGFQHYTRFPVSKCQKRAPVSPEKKFVMHIHLREFTEKHEFKPSIIDGMANHMAYHRCALKLDKYEVVVQGEHLSQFLGNEKIAHAVKEGWITLLVRNPIIPNPLMQTGSASNCYYQAYTQNMAILQHWQENVKLYFFDTDEYLNSAPDLTSEEFMRIVNSHTAIGFSRRMVFCSSCNPDKAEVKTMSLTKSTLLLNDHALRDPKLVVDPNRVGCYIVHWAGCGDETKLAPVARMSIMHFENLYSHRWTLENRLRLGNETVYQPPPIVALCDPTHYDWKSPLPSFHKR